MGAARAARFGGIAPPTGRPEAAPAPWGEARAASFGGIAPPTGRPEAAPAPGAPPGPARGLFGDQGPRLGVEIEERDGELTIKTVTPGSVAHRLGLRPDDVLLEVNGTRIGEISDVRAALAQHDRRVEVKVRRGSGTHTAVIQQD